MLLLKIKAGSHLYGYATPESDTDFYEVCTEKFPPLNPKSTMSRESNQTIINGIDTTQMSFSNFMVKAQTGSHQALDAMFAAETEFDIIKDLRNNFYAGYEVIPTYARIITKFALQTGYRKQRHALRTMVNLKDIMLTGRYEPELSEDKISYIMDYAHLEYPEFRKALIKDSPIDLSYLLPKTII